MKRTNLLLALLFVFVAFIANAQITNGGFEDWTTTNPTGWVGAKTHTTALIITKVTTNVHGGSIACGLTNTYTAHRRFTSTAVSVTNGTAYVISFWVRGTGQVRTGMYTGAANAGFGYLTYNPYVSATATWTQVTQTLVSDTTTAAAEFIFSVGVGGDVVIDDVTVTTGTVPTVSIYDIQYATAAPYVSTYNGQPVITGGIVTAKYDNGLFLQDATGPWNGIYIYDSAHIASAGIARGDSIIISGTVNEYLTYTELGSISNVTKVSSGNTLHPAYNVTKANSTTEELEGVLVKLTNMPCVDASGSASYGEFVLYNGDTTQTGGLLFEYTTAAVGTNYDITGVVYLAYGGVVRVEPRDANDVSISTGINETDTNSITSIYPNPSSDYITIDNMQDINFIRISNILGETVINMDVTNQTETINTSSLPNGIYFVSLINKNGICETKKFSKE
ncbi:MAG: T9SS type A sorting domain-containing protein [Bacteroidota bacterium]